MDKSEIEMIRMEKSEIEINKDGKILNWEE